MSIINETASGGAVTSRRFLWCGEMIWQKRDGGNNTVVRQYVPEGENYFGTTSSSWGDPYSGEPYGDDPNDQSG